MKKKLSTSGIGKKKPILDICNGTPPGSPVHIALTKSLMANIVPMGKHGSPIQL